MGNEHDMYEKYCGCVDHSIYQESCGMGPIPGTERNWTVFCQVHTQLNTMKSVKEKAILVLEEMKQLNMDITSIENLLEYYEKETVKLQKELEETKIEYLKEQKRKKEQKEAYKN